MGQATKRLEFSFYKKPKRHVKVKNITLTKMWKPPGPVQYPVEKHEKTWKDMVKSLLLPSKKATTPSVSDPSTPLIEKIAEIGYDRASNSFPVDKIRDFQPSLILFLYKDAFLCRNISAANPEGYAQPYDRNARAFLESIDTGFIPDGLAKYLPCVFREGCIVAEIQDFRHTDVNFPVSTASLPKAPVLKQSLQVPYIRRVLLRPTRQMVLESLFSTADVSSFENDIPLQVQLESILLQKFHSTKDLCLDPSPDVLRVATQMHQNCTQKRYVKCSQTHQYRILERVLKRPEGRATSAKRRRTSSSDASSTADATKAKATGKKTGTRTPRVRKSRKKVTPSDTLQSTPIGAPKELGIGTTTYSNKAEGWDFLTSLLEEAPDEKLSLTSDVSPSKIDSILSISTKPLDASVPVEPPLPDRLYPCDITSSAWFNAADEFRRKVAQAAQAEMNHITNVQPIRRDAKGRIGSIDHLSAKIGKTLWPTETIAMARVRQQSRQKLVSTVMASPLRGIALAEAAALGAVQLE